MGDLDEELLEDLYSWVDSIPLSRPKKDIRRDFSDGALVAELIHHFVPRLVDTNNYPGASNLSAKVTNWSVLNRKVFKKLGFDIADDVMKNIASCKPWAIEQFLMMLRRKIDRYVYEEQREKEKSKDHRPEADRGYQQANRPRQGRRGEGHAPSKPSSQAVQQTNSVNRLYHGHGPQSGTNSYGGGGGGGGVQQPMSQYEQHDRYRGSSRDTVPKLVVEEKEQELLAKDETITILEAKVRRLNHLLHLKDVRIDDLQQQVEELRAKRPTANTNYKR